MHGSTKLKYEMCACLTEENLGSHTIQYFFDCFEFIFCFTMGLSLLIKLPSRVFVGRFLLIIKVLFCLFQMTSVDKCFSAPHCWKMDWIHRIALPIMSLWESTLISKHVKILKKKKCTFFSWYYEIDIYYYQFCRWCSQAREKRVKPL